MAAVVDLDQIEGTLTFARIGELDDDPVEGNFDCAHLLEIHRRIFQDLPGYGPGKVRPPANSHIKFRELISTPVRYRVYYADREGTIDRGGMGPLEGRIDKALMVLGGRDGVLSLGDRHLDEDDLIDSFARLYAELDYLHPFNEGNSRTLRAFMTQIARAAGRELRWIPNDVHTANELAIWRDEVYLARDHESAKRALHEQGGPHQERAMTAIARLSRGISLMGVFRRVLTMHPGVDALRMGDHSSAPLIPRPTSIDRLTAQRMAA